MISIYPYLYQTMQPPATTRLPPLELSDSQKGPAALGNIPDIPPSPAFRMIDNSPVVCPKHMHLINVISAGLISL